MTDAWMEIPELPPTPPKSPVPPGTPKPSGQRPSPTMVLDKTLSSAANLANLLPTGTLLAFQILSPSFSNKGSCGLPSNMRYLTFTLILTCSLSCLFFSLTDWLRGGDGKLYYGLAASNGLYVFNYHGSDDERPKVFKDLSMYRIRPLDVVHAVFTIGVFLALTFGDTAIQRCLFPGAGPDTKQLLVNLPLGAAVMSSLVFMVFPTWRKGIMVFPTWRKGIGYDAAPRQQP